MTAFRPLALLPLVVLSCSVMSSRAATTDIRDGHGGKRLLFVDGNDIRTEPGGTRLLYIDGRDIRDEPGGKRLLCVDGDAVRHDPFGIRLALLAGRELRRYTAGKSLIDIKHPEISEEFGGKVLFFIDGPALTKPQLVAVLYQLKPELFTLTAKEEAEFKKDMADAAAEDEANAKKDPFDGKYTVLSFSSSDDRKAGGAMTVQKKGEYYQIAFSNSKTNEVWEGVGFMFKPQGGDTELWAAMGPQASMAMALYTIGADGNWSGAWVPHYLLDTPASFGSEKLTRTGVNNYTVAEGKAPKTLVPYQGGTMVLTPAAKELNSSAKTFTALWTLGDFKLGGVGFVYKDKAVVAAGKGKDVTIVRFVPQNGSMAGDFLTLSGAFGFYTFNKE